MPVTATAIADYQGFSSLAKFSQKITAQPAAVVAPAAATQTFTVPGLKEGYITLVEMPDIETGLVKLQAWCAANDVLSITFQATAGDVTPASQAIYIMQL